MNYPSTAIELLWNCVAKARRGKGMGTGFVADVFTCYFGWRILWVEKGVKYLKVQVEPQFEDEFRNAFPDATVDRRLRSSVILKLSIPMEYR